MLQRKQYQAIKILYIMISNVNYKILQHEGLLWNKKNVILI